MQTITALDNRHFETRVMLGNDPAMSPIFSDEYGNWWLSCWIESPEYHGADKVALPVFTDWFIDGIPEVA